jgi:hypothetical protein
MRERHLSLLRNAFLSYGLGANLTRAPFRVFFYFEYAHKVLSFLIQSAHKAKAIIAGLPCAGRVIFLIATISLVVI